MKSLTKTIALIAILIIATPVCSQIVGNSYENLVDIAGTPHHQTEMVYIGLMILTYDDTEFFYLDTQTNIIVLHRCFIHKRIAARILKEYTRELEVSQGWFISPDHKILARIILENGKHKYETKLANNPLAQLIFKQGY